MNSNFILVMVNYPTRKGKSKLILFKKITGCPFDLESGDLKIKMSI